MSNKRQTAYNLIARAGFDYPADVWHNQKQDLIHQWPITLAELCKTDEDLAFRIASGIYRERMRSVPSRRFKYQHSWSMDVV
jgi:hypothetical protein